MPGWLNPINHRLREVRNYMFSCTKSKYLDHQIRNQILFFSQLIWIPFQGIIISCVDTLIQTWAGFEIPSSVLLKLHRE